MGRNSVSLLDECAPASATFVSVSCGGSSYATGEGLATLLPSCARTRNLSLPRYAARHAAIPEPTHHAAVTLRHNPQVRSLYDGTIFEVVAKEVEERKQRSSNYKIE